MRAGIVNWIVPLLLCVCTTSLASASLAAQDERTPPKKEVQKPKLDLAALKSRMKARYVALKKLRDSGTIGETQDGIVAVLKPSDSAKLLNPKDKKKGTIGALIDAEVADRRILYAYLAKQLKISIAKVAAQNGLRNLNKAKPDHWFRLKDGKWAQRKSIAKKVKK